VDGQAGGARLQARRARLRVGLTLAAFVAYCGCASTGDPPGGPPRTTPPVLLSTVPESGAVLAEPPRRVDLNFDEVIGERIAAPQPMLAGAVLVSPARTPVSVDWHRDRITISVKGGFRAQRIYRVELLPVITDLHQNRMKQGRTIVFSTGPAIPSATLAGTVVDWTAGHAANGALVQAVLLPDSLPYLALADSVGNFSLREMPPGDYLVYGILDQNNNRRRDPREAFDTARVALTDSALVGLYAFTHDTIGPRIRSADVLDSVTVRITFDRPVNPDAPVDTSMVHVSPLADTTRDVPLRTVFTAAAYDSISKVEAAARTAAQAAKDSAARAAAAARDTTHRGAAPAPQPTAARPPVPPPPLGAAPPRDTLPPVRRDTSRAIKMLARRPAPSDTRVVRFAAALEPGARYAITTEKVVGLTGVTAPLRGRTTFTAPRLPPTRPTADSLRRARADTTPVGRRPTPGAAPAPPAGSRPDTSATAAARRDSVPTSPPAKPR